MCENPHGNYGLVKCNHYQGEKIRSASGIGTLPSTAKGVKKKFSIKSKSSNGRKNPGIGDMP